MDFQTPWPVVPTYMAPAWVGSRAMQLALELNPVDTAGAQFVPAEKERNTKGFADTLAEGLMKAGGGKVMVSVEVERVEDGEVVDVTPVEGGDDGA